MERTRPGPAAVRTIRLFGARCSERLTPTALRLLVEMGEVMHEGEVNGENYFGTTMFSLDLDALEGVLGCEVADGTVLVSHLRLHPLFRIHLMRLARLEAMRRLGPASVLRSELRMRLDGRTLCADLDVETARARAEQR